MSARKQSLSDEGVKAAVDELLGEFGAVGEAGGEFSDHAAAKPLPTGERHDVAPSSEPEALWGGGGRKKK